MKGSCITQIDPRLYQENAKRQIDWIRNGKRKSKAAKVLALALILREG